MQFIKLIVLLILLGSPALVKAQNIKWEESRPLVWEDFNGKSDYHSNHVAVSVWDTYYKYNVELKDSIYTIKFTLENVFLTQFSWRKRGYSDEYILGHEQLHFDINELYTRKLAAAFRAAVFTSNYKAEIQAIFNKYREESNGMESKYDIETENSRNYPIQLKWQLFIYLELKKLPRNY